MQPITEEQPTDIFPCDGCGKCISNQKAFFIYEYRCCSTSCLAPFRIKRQEEEYVVHDKRSNPGAFSYQYYG